MAYVGLPIFGTHEGHGLARAVTPTKPPVLPDDTHTELLQLLRDFSNFRQL